MGRIVEKREQRHKFDIYIRKAGDSDAALDYHRKYKNSIHGYFDDLRKHFENKFVVSYKYFSSDYLSDTSKILSDQSTTAVVILDKAAFGQNNNFEYDQAVMRASKNYPHNTIISNADFTVWSSLHNGKEALKSKAEYNAGLKTDPKQAPYTNAFKIIEPIYTKYQ